ncbi:MAG: DUF4089 domain-containing protein [Chelatococcus sp.]|jgi:hypothetical protein|uniref:DUF4089 domain-containing protein n=1 Tax=Chelatococcus sp. TaxID=1953771 RepID=UPI0025C71FA3|nr:DUF4089 domain-containing protein [Chelatococcus sp.]MBX3536648.1 DUF4089 domain-containing protein [Chelatococcus sp.]
MSEAKREFDPAAHLDAIAPALGLTITAEQRPGVIRFLATAEAMARIVQAVPVGEDTLELAPVFRPGQPGQERTA